MKKFFPFISLVFLSFSLSGQDDISFPDSNTTWTDATWFVWGWPPCDTGYIYYKTNGDTIFNDTSYNKIASQYKNAYCFLRDGSIVKAGVRFVIEFLTFSNGI